MIMKNRFIYFILILAATLASCSDSFTDRPSLSGATVSNYYNTADEVRAATSTIYSGLAWSGYEARALDCIGEILSGNEQTYRPPRCVFLTHGKPFTRSTDGQAH